MKLRLCSLLLVLGFIFGASISHAADNATVKGLFLKRSDNTYIHVEMVGVRMQFKVLDENFNLLEEPVFTRGVMRVDVKGRDSERMVIRPTGDGKTLQAIKTIRKPHILEARGRLFKGEEDTTGEPFFVQYNQHRLEENEVVPDTEE